MKRKMVFGVLAFLLVLQAQTVFAQDRQTENLWKAVNAGNVTDARAAIQRRADVNNRNSAGSIIISRAVQNGNIEIVRLLLDNGANPNVIGTVSSDHPLTNAIEKGNLEMVKLLIDKGANVNARNSIGSSPLRSAISEGNIEMVKLLVDRGVNINNSDRYGTPFPAAAQAQNIELLRFLLERGANINGRCHNTLNLGVQVNDRTALHHAVSTERMDIVKFLVENGINVNARDSQGRSALNIALEKGNMNIHAYLIANGAMEFEPTQNAQPVAPAPAPSSTTNVYVQPTAPAQPAPEPATPTLRNGKYACSGTNITLSLSNPIVNVYANNSPTSIWQGTCRINGNQLIITVTIAVNEYAQFRGSTFVYTITSDTSFSGNGETWVRTGF